jgi:hypothetical protein
MASVGEMKAVDAKTFTIVLKEPFGLVLEALGKPSSNVPFMMPKRVAETDPFKQIDDYTGSGPSSSRRTNGSPAKKSSMSKTQVQAGPSRPPCWPAARW